MLLHIDKVLQLLSEGKDIYKIAELSGNETDDVVKIIDDARALLQKHEKNRVRRKIIIHKKSPQSTNTAVERTGADQEDIFQGAELSAVPMEDTLIMYIAVYVEDDLSYVGIIIQDKDNRQVGKLTIDVAETNTLVALYQGIKRAMDIAVFFHTKNLKIRTDSPLLVKQLTESMKIQDETISSLQSEVLKKSSQIPQCKFEAISKMLNEKAYFISKNKAQDILKAKNQEKY